MKHLILSAILLLGMSMIISSCEDGDMPCSESTWYQDADGDGLGNPDVSQSACEQPDGYVADNNDADDTAGSAAEGSTPVSAFDEFNSDAVTVSFDGADITIVSNGLPDHTSPYWESSESLYIDPVVANTAQMSPGTISDGSYTVTVPASPEKASSTSATGLGAIGIATSGAPIFNDEEGPNISLSENVASGFDYAGGHMGPTGYHYHLESSDVAANTTVSHDDEQLVGILQDGFLIYGRKCNSTGDYPTDLDASGGHNSSTQHSDTDEFYHYHIINEFYIGSYILLFGVDLQGTPNQIM
ncbi:MAG: YHYH protein [Bacteroidia bacterium]